MFPEIILEVGRILNLAGGWTNPFEKNANVKLDHETPNFEAKINKTPELPPPGNHLSLQILTFLGISG